MKNEFNSVPTGKICDLLLEKMLRICILLWCAPKSLPRRTKKAYFKPG